MQQRRSQLPRTVQHPAAPRLIPGPLPRDTAPIHQRPVIVALGNGQVLPTALLFQNDAVAGIDARLAFHTRPRPVVRPAITFMPEFPEYLWGAVDDHVSYRESPMRIHFDEEPVPATNPPVHMMRIDTGFGDWLIIEPRRGSHYVSVVDVQRTVIQWMKEIRFRAGETDRLRLSSWVRVADGEGTELEVEVWVWMGLMHLGGTMETWVLKLIEA
ncbi:hypothetical protein P691DRAFT_333801 [Macrolepiota fuliginosa MF-IS2]|uniref:Uncharacterized protein n=1 Tax=Macrolepiota fuliginosa MF-IS2 TaxID=1400762 RepID=A0A9P5X4S1_9AGAR|nr:hypothetical protein P691DRAFT_333801 [Macrolepiota fuliginosa MF-IS2]